MLITFVLFRLHFNPVSRAKISAARSCGAHRLVLLLCTSQTSPKDIKSRDEIIGTEVDDTSGEDNTEP